MELTQEQKEEIVNEINNSEDQESEGNVSIFTMGDLSELKPFLEELTPMEMFDKSVALNQTSIANLDDLLPRLSKKNLIRLFFATMKLPDKDSVLKFGGSREQQAFCEMAYANSQMARNALVHVLGTTAIAQARLVKKREEEEALKEDNQDTIQEESNE